MNNEIKEIKRLKAIVSCIKDSELLEDGEYQKVHSDFIISLEENKEELIYYITNLQEYYNDNVNRYEELIEKYSNLQEENKRLQDLSDYNLQVRINTETFYKQRFDKAIKYIETHTDKLKTTIIPKIDFNYKKLLEILQGGNKE